MVEVGEFFVVILGFGVGDVSGIMVVVGMFEYVVDKGVGVFVRYFVVVLEEVIGVILL